MTSSQRLMTPILGAVAGLSLVLALPALAALDANGHKEIQTAVQHAEFAVKAKNTDGVHQHLHHVINCLVGTDGEGFDAAAGNPCKDMGKGALNDASESETAVGLLNQSLSLAKIGLEINDHRSARAVAVAAKDLLQLAEKEGAAHRK